MNTIPYYLIETVRDLAEPGAIITGGCDVLHSNRSFDELFHFQKLGEERRHCSALRELELQIFPDGRVSSPQFLTIPGHPKKIETYVYLVNRNADREHVYLVLCRDLEKRQDETRRKAMLNPYVDEETFRTEKLAPQFNDLIGENIQFRKAPVTAKRAAKSNISVLIIGESGTGKEILARAIHQTSHRSNKPLIDVNCAAIPDTLIESELFGYEKGAFTGARTEGRKGYFDEAHERDHPAG